MELEQILQLIDRVSDSNLTSFHFESGEVKLSMKCAGQTDMLPGRSGQEIPDRLFPAGSSAAAPELPAAGLAQAGAEGDRPVEEIRPEQGNLVKSPLVGTFYAAPSEDADSFVKVGSHVEQGQVLAIVEAMKLMNEIESDYEGEIKEIYVNNGDAVEYGQPLFRIQ